MERDRQNQPVTVLLMSIWAATLAALLPDANRRSVPGERHAVADDTLAPVIIEHITATSDASRR